MARSSDWTVPSAWAPNKLYCASARGSKGTSVPFFFGMSASSCYHCGLPIPDDVDLSVKIGGETRAMCCYGCQAVAQSIVENGLEDYYRSRDALPESPREAMPAWRYALEDRPTEGAAAYPECVGLCLPLASSIGTAGCRLLADPAPERVRQPRNWSPA